MRRHKIQGNNDSPTLDLQRCRAMDQKPLDRQGERQGARLTPAQRCGLRLAYIFVCLQQRAVCEHYKSVAKKRDHYKIRFRSYCILRIYISLVQTVRQCLGGTSTTHSRTAVCCQKHSRRMGEASWCLQRLASSLRDGVLNATHTTN